MSNLGVVESVFTLIESELPQYKAEKLLNSSIDDLREKYNFNEKEVVRILAVSQLRNMLKGEVERKKYGFECIDEVVRMNMAKELAKENKVAIIAINERFRVVSQRYFNISEPNLYQEIFKYLYSEPILRYIVVLRENSISYSTRDLAKNFSELGALCGIELFDFIVCTGTEQISLK